MEAGLTKTSGLRVNWELALIEGDLKRLSRKSRKNRDPFNSDQPLRADRRDAGDDAREIRSAFRSGQSRGARAGSLRPRNRREPRHARSGVQSPSARGARLRATERARTKC